MNAITLNGVKGRRELKHEIVNAVCYLLRNNLKHLMKADPHAKNDGKYLIRSVYFDGSHLIVTLKQVFVIMIY